MKISRHSDFVITTKRKMFSFLNSNFERWNTEFRCQNWKMETYCFYIWGYLLSVFHEITFLCSNWHFNLFSDSGKPNIYPHTMNTCLISIFVALTISACLVQSMPMFPVVELASMHPRDACLFICSICFHSQVSLSCTISI